MDKIKQYDRPIRMAEGVYWVGFYEEETNFHCNPYLVMSGDQAILIDGGSRPDFAVVMMKILQTGLRPSQITALIYQHYDPDLCGSMQNFVEMIGNPSLKILTHAQNKIFIHYYIEKGMHKYVETIGRNNDHFTLNGRMLSFHETPFCHNAGSFITYDPRTKTLFSSDLFGSISSHWDLYITLEEACYTCIDYIDCPNKKPFCPLPDILQFHREIMPTGKALRRAMATIKELDIECIAPQHGGILSHKRDIAFLIDKLENLDGVGIDAY